MSSSLMTSIKAVFMPAVCSLLLAVITTSSNADVLAESAGADRDKAKGANARVELSSCTHLRAAASPQTANWEMPARRPPAPGRRRHASDRAPTALAVNDRAGLRANWQALMPRVFAFPSLMTVALKTLTNFTVAGAASDLHRLPVYLR